MQKKRYQEPYATKNTIGCTNKGVNYFYGVVKKGKNQREKSSVPS